MIRLSRLSDYAIVVMCEMGASRHLTFSARQLHEKTQISQPAIMKILKLLAGAGLVSSSRGAKGGYSLACDPREVSIKDIVTAIDGPVSVTRCSHASGEACAFEANCMAKSGWNVVNNALQDTLSRFSIADFLATHAAQHHQATGTSHVLSFH